MKKAHIVIVAALVLAVVVLGIVYQIFLKERLDKYREDHVRLKELVAKSLELDEQFKGRKPQAILDGCKEHMPVWEDAISGRAVIFDLDNVLEVDAVPDGKWPKFWYEEEYQKRVQELQLAAFEKRVAIPNTTFGAPSPQELVDFDVTEEQAKQWLQLLQLGSAGTRLLLDAKALQIDEAVLYPLRIDHEVLKAYTYGFVFYIYLDDLAKLLRDLADREDEYYNVQALRVASGQLRSYDNPPLKVEMLLSRATYDGEAEVEPLRAVNDAGEADIWVRVAEIEEEVDEEGGRKTSKQPWYLRMWSFIGL